MKAGLLALAGLIAAGTTGAFAQGVDLSGQYRCVQGCKGGLAGPAYITQTGYQLNLVNEVGEPTRGWIDGPGHLWTEAWHQGAIFTPDAMTIQFDRGSVWEGIVAPPPPPPPPPPRHK
jgi:hypothetical protein